MTGRLSLNQATIKYATVPEAVRITVAASIDAIGLWREPVADYGLKESAAVVNDAGLRVSSLCRGGFLTASDGTSAREAIDDNRRAIEEAAVLGAPTLVMVVGGLPPGSTDLRGARQRVADSLSELAPEAHGAGISLAIEPLHPMYAADRAVVNTLMQALDLAAPFDPADVQVVIDAFHVWWDPDLDRAIQRAGREGRIASYQVCDFVTPLAADALLSRGLPGDGHIDFAHLTRAVTAAGYAGDIETEVFRQEVWDADPHAVARQVVERYRKLIEPHL